MNGEELCGKLAGIKTDLQWIKENLDVVDTRCGGYDDRFRELEVFQGQVKLAGMITWAIILIIIGALVTLFFNKLFQP